MRYDISPPYTFLEYFATSKLSVKPASSGEATPFVWQADELFTLLFFGDIVGQPGRKAVTHYMHHLHPLHPTDVVIANVENATHGFGFSKKNYDELRSVGIHIFTGGNHSFDREDSVAQIREMPYLVRPANFGHEASGVGWQVFPIVLQDGTTLQLGVVNLLGQVFMGHYDSPWESLDEAMEALHAHTPIVFLDMHAETTAEKMSLGWYASGLGLSAMAGTHTHVQTADEKILNGHTGFITDAGFNGAEVSVIGMEVQPSIKRARTLGRAKMAIPEESSTLQVNAVRFTLHRTTGQCVAVERVFHRLPQGLSS
ncbi:MAG: TIGR00282 family metallophosphoesterase [Vampirovibrionales bacterium]